jgi:hypothetical protein
VQKGQIWREYFECRNNGLYGATNEAMDATRTVQSEAGYGLGKVVGENKGFLELTHNFNLMDDRYKGMTVHERLYMYGLLSDF